MPEALANEKTVQSCVIRSVDGEVFSGPLVSVTVPVASGYAQILPGHAESFMMLAAGDLQYITGRNSIETKKIDGGVLYADGEQITILI